VLVTPEMSLQLLPETLLAPVSLQEDRLVLLLFVKAERALELLQLLPGSRDLPPSPLVHLLYVFGRGPLLPEGFDPSGRDVDFQLVDQQKGFFCVFEVAYVVSFGAQQLLVVGLPAAGVLVELEPMVLVGVERQPFERF
jgi:hypothetical protein